MPASPTHLVLIPSYNPGPRVGDTVRAARAQWNPVWVVVDGSSDGSAEQLQAMAAADDGLQRHRPAREPRQGRRGARRHHAGRRARLHACADHGFRRPAPGRPDPRLHGRVAGRPGGDGARQAGVRAGGAGATGQRAQGVERLGQPGNAVDGHRRFAVRLPRLSHRAAAEDHARQPLHAPLRLRPRGRRPPVLGRRAAAQPRRAGALPVAPTKAASRTSNTCATTRC